MNTEKESFIEVVIVPAYTNSDVDGVNFAILYDPVGLKKAVKETTPFISEIENRLGSSVDIVLYDANVDFGVESETIQSFLGSDSIDITDLKDPIKGFIPEDFEFVEVDQRINGHNMRISEWGVTIVGYGKYTGDEFWCELSKTWIESNL